MLQRRSTTKLQKCFVDNKTSPDINGHGGGGASRYRLSFHFRKTVLKVQRWGTLSRSAKIQIEALKRYSESSDCFQKKNK